MPRPPAPSRLRRLVPPGLGGLALLAIVGASLAWQASLVNTIEPDAPLPVELPASRLMGNMAYTSVGEPPARGEVRIPAPTPADPEEVTDSK